MPSIRAALVLRIEILLHHDCLLGRSPVLLVLRGTLLVGTYMTSKELDGNVES